MSIRTLVGPRGWHEFIEFFVRLLILSWLIGFSNYSLGAIWECIEANGAKRFTNIRADAIAGGCTPLDPNSPLLPMEAPQRKGVADVSRPKIKPRIWEAPKVPIVSEPSEIITTPDKLYSKLSVSVYELISQANPKSYQISYGSAVAVTARFALTNCHIVGSDTNLLFLIDKNGRKIQAKLIGAHPSNDQCVIEANSADLVYVPAIRSFASLREGERVYAIGNPRGLSRTISDGLVSGKREAKGMRAVQTTAPISSGSSGGGLFDSAGNLIGITTASLRESQNLNLAIPAEDFWAAAR